MGRALLRVLLIRAALVALPLVIWLVWAHLARRAGRPMGSTPWAWLFAAGAVLVGVSLLAERAMEPKHSGGTYVPGEAQADGSVSKGRFEP